jgi:hypothetical protein
MRQRAPMLAQEPRQLVLRLKLTQQLRSLEQGLQYLLYEFFRRYLFP